MNVRVNRNQQLLSDFSQTLSAPDIVLTGEKFDMALPILSYSSLT